MKNVAVAVLADGIEQYFLPSPCFVAGVGNLRPADPLQTAVTLWPT